MAQLTITQQPGGTQRWALSKENMVYAVSLEDYAPIQGVRARRTMTINAGGTVGQTFTILSGVLLEQTGVISHTLTVDANGTADMTIRAIQSTQTLQQWIDESLLPALNSASAFENAFYFTRSASRVVCWAKGYNAAGLDYTPNISGTIDMSVFSDVPGEEAPAEQEVRLEARVHVSSQLTSGAYVSTPWLGYSMELDGAGASLTHDFSAVFNDLIDSMDRHGGGANYRRPVLSVRKGYVQFRVVANDTESFYCRSNTINILKGGREANDQGVSYLTTYVGSGSTGPTSFLTARRKELWTHRRVLDYLSFHTRWNTGNTNNVLVKATVMYTNGNSFGDTLMDIPATELQYHQVITIPAGFDQLNLESISPGDTPYKYELAVEMNGVTALKQVYRLLADTDTGATLIYHNDFGMPEGVWCEGVREVSVKHKRDMIAVAKPTGSLTDWLEEVSHSRARQASVSLSTTALVAADWNGQLAMLNSKQLWLRLDGATRDYPVQLVPGEVSTRAVSWDADNARAIVVEVMLNKVY